MKNHLLFALVAFLLATLPARAAITTVSPWHTAGNNSFTDGGGAWNFPNVQALHRSKAAFGAGPDSGQMRIYALGFSDLHGISYANEAVADVSILPSGGWTGGISFYGFDLGVAGAPRDVHYEIWNGDHSSLLASATINIGATHATINSYLFSQNGFHIQFESAGTVGIDNYRFEDSDSAAPKPKISLRGNNLEISNNDSTPSLADHTDFGSPNFVGGTVTRTFTIANLGELPLALTGTAPNFINLTGSPAFSIVSQPSTPITPNPGSTTFSIAFTPTTTGLKTAVLSIPNNDTTKNPFTFSISGYWLGFSDGTLDRNFATNGFAHTDFGSNQNEFGLAVATQPDGKIIVAGNSISYPNYTNSQIALARYLPTGGLDPTFGNNGFVLTDVSPVRDDYARAVIVQPDGKILVGGSAGTDQSVAEFAVLRYASTGQLDSGFGTGGKVVTALISPPSPSNETDFGNAMILQPNGSIVIAGYAEVPTGNPILGRVALVRYTATGQLDGTFNNGGKVLTPFGGSQDAAWSLAIQSDGKLIVCGQTFVGANWDTALMRYTTTGALDGSFGAGGKVTTSLSPGYDRATSVGVQADGKIVVAGETTNAGIQSFVLTRYSAYGNLDAGFGTNGSVVTPIGPSNSSGRSLVLQSDGKIVVAGTAVINGQNDFALARFTATGSLDPFFGTAGIVTTAISPLADEGRAVALLPDNRIVVAGDAINNLGSRDFAVAVYGLPLPNIAVAQAAALNDGLDTVSIATAPVATTSPPLTFTISNPGNAELNSLSITTSGPNASDFNVSTLSATTIPIGVGSATFTVTFSPSTSGLKTASLQIQSNVPGDKNPFDIAITGRALSYTEDFDNDGLNDAAEFLMGAFGFDWQIAQTTLVNTYYAAAANTGFYTVPQIQAQNSSDPLLQRDPNTGIFTLTLSLEKSTTLEPGSFSLFPMTPPEATIDNGVLNFLFTSPEPKAFFRLSAE